VLVEERALQAAMLSSDVRELERLLHPELLAVAPDGQLIDRAADLEGHRSGVLKISELDEEDVRVKVLGDLAVTFVVLRLRGTIDDADVSGRMRYHTHVDVRRRHLAGGSRAYQPSPCGHVTRQA